MVTVNENISFTDHASWIWLPNCSKLAVYEKNYNEVIIYEREVIVNFFWRCRISLVKFSYWSKFHVNIITCPGVITIFAYKGSIRNQEIRNTSVWVLPISGDWRELGTPKLPRMFLMKSHWVLQNVRFTVFAVSDLLRENQRGGWTG